MTLSPEALAVLETLATEGFEDVEVYTKRGRSRTVSLVTGQQTSCEREEAGWAVRAGDARRSFFYAASGLPDPDTPWPEADGLGLRLPTPRPAPAWTPPSELDAPLIGENEAGALLAGLERALGEEIPKARLTSAVLEDGSSESHLVSNRSLRAATRQRAAALRLEAIGAERTAGSISLVAVERHARRFNPVALARRLADRLLIAHSGSSPARDRGAVLLAPPVAAQLLAALRGLWIGPQATAAIAPFVDRSGRAASSAFTLVDDGRLATGLLAAPVDGEGQPTREVALVEEGIFRQPLLAWWQTAREPARGVGCSLRPSWRDLPRPGPTHLFLRPDPRVTAGSLLTDTPRGYYLLDVEGGARVTADFERFALPVCGFAIDGGRPTGAVSGAWLTGSVSTLLHGIVAVARDLTFLPFGNGMVGAPTVLVKGLELRHAPSMHPAGPKRKRPTHK